MLWLWPQIPTSVHPLNSTAMRSLIGIVFCCLFPIGAFSASFWNCRLIEQTIDCNFTKTDANNDQRPLISKMNNAVESLKRLMSTCTISAFSARGEMESADIPQITSIEIDTKYKCLVNEDDRTAKRRSAIEGYAHEFFDCSNKLFKSYARGFDIYADGSRSHWDTLTQKLPWRTITDAPANSESAVLFGAVCE
jgi:hypothetical protein